MPVVSLVSYLELNLFAPPTRRLVKHAPEMVYPMYTVHDSTAKCFQNIQMIPSKREAFIQRQVIGRRVRNS